MEKEKSYTMSTLALVGGINVNTLRTLMARDRSPLPVAGEDVDTRLWSRHDALDAIRLSVAGRLAGKQGLIEKGMDWKDASTFCFAGGVNTAIYDALAAFAAADPATRMTGNENDIWAAYAHMPDGLGNPEGGQGFNGTLAHVTAKLVNKEFHPRDDLCKHLCSIILINISEVCRETFQRAEAAGIAFP